MNIGSMIRGLLGDSKAGEPKSLELKEGQVVRGVVLSVSESGKEAIVQIQGTPVRAELETPLQAGQAINFQVSPPGEGGLPVLKPVSSGETTLVSPQSMGEALETLGLNDAKAGREIVQAMQSAGVPLTKETAEKLNAVMSAKPAGVPTEQWLEAAVISVKRGLPVTPQSIKGLQQAIFGPQLHQLLSNLEEQINAWAGQKDTGVAGASTPINSSLPTAGVGVLNSGTTGNSLEANQAGSAVLLTGDDEVQDSAAARSPINGDKIVANSKAVAENSVSTSTVNIKAEAGPAAPTVGGNPQTLTGINTVGTKSAAEISVAAQTQDADIAVDQDKSDANARSHIDATKAAGDAGKGNAGIPVKASEQASVPPSTMKNTAAGDLLSAEIKNAADAEGAAISKGAVEKEVAASAGRSAPALLAKLQGVLTELRGSLPQLAEVPPASAAGQDPALAAGTPRGVNTPAPAALPVQDAPAPTPDTESWVGRVLKLLGAEHEQQAVRGGAGIAAEARSAAVANAADGRGAPLTPAALHHASVGDGSSADTLKGVLLQVLGSSDVPPALKEAAGQLVQHMTGQQLLLTTDRTAPFAQVTLFLPLNGPNGEETASVHIQSRRGRKGELDPANCRLWFDLNMKQLGQTLVDVQVVNHIVSLKLHNDEPWVLELLENRRDEIKTAVESIGYQLSGLKTEPLPVQKGTDSDKNFDKLTDYVPDSYRGVDYRI